MTELRFLGNMLSLKQSTWRRLASYPILNFLLHKTEYFNDFVTVVNQVQIDFQELQQLPLTTKIVLHLCKSLYDLNY